MSAVLLASADPTITWALNVAQAAEVAKEADEAAAAARQALNDLLAQKPS